MALTPKMQHALSLVRSLPEAEQDRYARRMLDWIEQWEKTGELPLNRTERGTD